MKLTSPAFVAGDALPERFAKEADNHSPPLRIADPPPQTESFVLIMDDPDAPSGTFTHWVVFDLDREMRELPEDRAPRQARLGRNSWGETAYGGPRPPSGTHRYFFRAYALDRRLDLPAGAPREQIEQAMRHHVLAQAELMGRYSHRDRAKS